MITAILDNQNDDFWLLAPAVGAFYHRLQPGQWVHAGDAVGELQVLNQRVPVLLPENIGVMRVAEIALGSRGAPAQYRQRLLQLVPANVEDGDALPGQVDPAEELGLPEGAKAIRASIDGQFYRSPSPDDPPFVAEGDTIKEGEVIGLIEVMKFFYEVTFEPPAPHDTWRVERLVAKDSAPLNSGETIAWVVPI